MSQQKRQIRYTSVAHYNKEIRPTDVYTFLSTTAYRNENFLHSWENQLLHMWSPLNQVQSTRRPVNVCLSAV